MNFISQATVVVLMAFVVAMSAGKPVVKREDGKCNYNIKIVVALFLFLYHVLILSHTVSYRKSLLRIGFSGTSE